MRPFSTLDTVGCPTPAPWASAAPDRPASARNARRRAPSTFIRSCRSLPIPRVLHHRTETTPRPARAATTEAHHDSNFLYWFKAPGCAPLRRARFPALAAPALLPSARSALPPPTRAHNWIGPGHETRTKPAASRGCLRRGRSDSGMGGAPFATAGRSLVSVVGLPSRPPSTQAEPSSRGPGRQGRSYSGALHLDALNHDRSTECGPKADGMGAGQSGGFREWAELPVLLRITDGAKSWVTVTWCQVSGVRVQNGLHRPARTTGESS